LKYKRDELCKLAELCLRIANYADRHGEKEDTAMCDELGLGYLALSGHLRAGVKAIADIQLDYSNAISKANLAKIGEESARDFLKYIFGDREIETINEADKERIKAFVGEIEKSWETD